MRTWQTDIVHVILHPVHTSLVTFRHVDGEMKWWLNWNRIYRGAHSKEIIGLKECFESAFRGIDLKLYLLFGL